jgi:diguanylate cyclase (GGDEF)-like protein/putative nucleotidyltransferase with HDIG domain
MDVVTSPFALPERAEDPAALPPALLPGPVSIIRALGFSYLGGGLLGIALAVPGTLGVSRPLLFALAALAFVFGTTLILLAKRLPNWVVNAGMAAGVALIGLVVWRDGPATSDLSLLYVWSGLNGFFFLSRRGAIAQIALIGVSYTALLALDGGGSFPLDRLLLTLVVVSVAGGLVAFLRSRVERLVAHISRAHQTDALTGFLNAAGFDDLVERELERAQRSGSRLSVVVCDIDRFKDFNEEHGHRKGEDALRRMAKVLATRKRRIDTLARLGGEEFALIVPDTDEHGAYVLADRVRRAVREEFARSYGLTASFGVASFPRHGGSAEDLMLSANRAVGAAKQLGRDRTVIFNAEISANIRAASVRQQAQSEEHLAAVLVLAETLDIRDTGTSTHSQSVGRYAQQIARELGLSEQTVERVHLAGLLHDIGKIGISDTILQKPGMLDEHEWAEMRKHPELGARILDGANLEDISAWVLAHHERPDGRGYPLGLSEDEIPLEARIIAVADSYEAMRADRVYKPGIDAQAAVAELRRCAGSQFDPHVVEAFLTALEREADEVAAA